MLLNQTMEKWIRMRMDLCKVIERNLKLIMAHISAQAQNLTKIYSISPSENQILNKKWNPWWSLSTHLTMITKVTLSTYSGTSTILSMTDCIAPLESWRQSMIFPKSMTGKMGIHLWYTQHGRIMKERAKSLSTFFSPVITFGTEIHLIHRAKRPWQHG